MLTSDAARALAHHRWALGRMYERVCEVCGTRFTARSTRATACSNRCSQRRKRQRQATRRGA